jgi:hypothetical protein
LVDRYSFDGSATTVIDSVGDKDGTLAGGATVSGGALQLSGGGQYASLPAGILQGFSSLTIETWFIWDTNTAQTWARVFDFGSGQDSYIYLTPDIGDTWTGTGGTPGFAFLAPGGAERQLAAADPIPVGTEVFIAVTIDGANATMYVNGVLAASGGIANNLSDLNPTTNNWLGKSEWWDYNDDPNPFLQGSIDEFRIYSTALTAGTIGLHYTYGPDSLSPEPATVWMLLGGLCLAVVPRWRRRASRRASGEVA